MLIGNFSELMASMAPITAVVPICKPLGCHITNTSVVKNTLNARIISIPLSILNKSISIYLDIYLSFVILN